MYSLVDIARSSHNLYRTVTYPLRLTPDFIIIGTQRGGTTSLYNYLIEHPDIVSAAMKEVHFFDNNYPKGLSWYRAQFPSLVQKYFMETIRKRPFVTGEASPYYLFHRHVPQRVAQTLFETRFIVLLRNPVDRAYSHYYHEVERGHETLSFEEALAQEEARTQAEDNIMARNEYYNSYNHQHYTYLARGIYVDQLQRWMNLFPREQFLLLKSEDFYKDPDAIFQQTLEFLNVPSTHLPPQAYKQYNNSHYTQPKMDLAIRKRLYAYFEPHNERLYAFLGKNFGWDH